MKGCRAYLVVGLFTNIQLRVCKTRFEVVFIKQGQISSKVDDSALLYINYI